MAEQTLDRTAPASEQSTGELVSRLSQELSHLVRDEMRLAQLEMSAKAKKAGLGAGLFGAAGIMALLGAGTLVACAVIALALVVDTWLAALIVGAALLVVAGIAALVGRREVAQAAPPVPTETLDSVRRDALAVRNGARR